jgi:hypothetical protein
VCLGRFLFFSGFLYLEMWLYWSDFQFCLESPGRSVSVQCCCLLCVSVVANLVLSLLWSFVKLACCSWFPIYIVMWWWGGCFWVRLVPVLCLHDNNMHNFAWLQPSKFIMWCGFVYVL